MEKEVSTTLLYSDSYSSYYHFGSSYSLCMWTTLLLLLLGLYTTVSLLSNVSACHNFIVAWNLITRSRRRDLDRIQIHKQKCSDRRIQTDDALITQTYQDHASIDIHSHIADNNDHSCPICLTDFKPDDSVSSSAKHTSCRHLFHHKCLKEWLQRDGTCPCCRSDILPAAPLPPSFLLYSSWRIEWAHGNDTWHCCLSAAWPEHTPRPLYLYLIWNGILMFEYVCNLKEFLPLS